VVEGARLENEAGQQHQAIPKEPNAYAISDLAFQTITQCASVNFDVLRGFEPHVSQSYHNPQRHFRSHTIDEYPLDTAIGCCSCWASPQDEMTRSAWAMIDGLNISPRPLAAI
jgi:hypothetical protein